MRRKHLALLLALFWLIGGLFVTVSGARQQPAGDYDTKLAAALRMEDWMGALREEKAALGLELGAEDLHRTGLLGEEYTGITTTHGVLEAKRTTANPDMAALLVEMLTQAGVQTGDTVGAGFSGSFPALNLAVLAACQTMGVNCVYIASVGASAYGANQPQFTFPDMVHVLVRDGRLNTAPALVTPGGVDDCGLDMEPELLSEIQARIGSYGWEWMAEGDWEENISRRMELYQREGPISCFIGVGGNLTTTGPGEKNVPYGVIEPYTVRTADENSGLIQRYSRGGLPTLHLLNVKQLVADYGLAYDPETPLPPGESAVYYETVYPRLPAAAGLAGGAAILLAGFLRRKGEGTKCSG